MNQNKLMNKILQFIEDNLENTLLVEDIAAEAGYSEFYFSRLFREYMGVSVMEYIKKRKMIKASEMILAGKKIIDVALLFGWQSHAGFSRAFKNEFGFSPSLLRAMIVEMEQYGGRAMSHLFLKRADEHLSAEELFVLLKTEMKENGIEYDSDELQKNYELSCKVYEGVKRYSGDDYVTHPLNVAILLADLNADESTIAAGMFCDVLRTTKVAPQELAEKLSEKVYVIVLEVNTAEGAFEKYNEDVMLVKLAERLHNMRTIEFIPEEAREKKAKETFEIFMPLARKLGNKKLISELNDLSLKYI